MPRTSGFQTLYVIQRGMCYFCKGFLDYNRRKTVVHHINGIHSDNRLINRCLAHNRCHLIHHKRKQ